MYEVPCLDFRMSEDGCCFGFALLGKDRERMGLITTTFV
jgi:hypothetical protein